MLGNRVHAGRVPWMLVQAALCSRISVNYLEVACKPGIFSYCRSHYV
jgi:hypothetical protein